MTKNVIVLVLVGFVFAGCASAHQHSKVVQWEYTSNDYSTWNTQLATTALNNLATDGWVLVSAVPIKTPNGEDQIRYICKRPKQ